MQRSQFLIAVFDDWDALARVLDNLAGKDTDRAAALLHKRRDGPSGDRPSLLRDMTELRFAASLECVRCTRGKLADELAARSSAGAVSLAEALGSWLTHEQARELERHVANGRLVLWLRPATQDDFETVCARLVQASPHLVGLCTIDLGP